METWTIDAQAATGFQTRIPDTVMQSMNRREPSVVEDHELQRSVPTARRMLGGFVILAAPAAVYAVDIAARDYAQRATLAPNEGACGSAMLLAFVMLCIVSPACGCVGALIGWATMIPRW